MRVLVAIDRTPASEAVLDFVPRLLPDTDHEILVLTVAPRWGPVPVTWAGLGLGAGVGVTGYPPAAETLPDRGTEAEPEARAWVERAGEAVGADETIVEPGEAVTAILGVAEEHDVDLVVVGSSDKGWLSRLLSGSVSRSLVADAPCPVLVVR